MVSGFLLIGVFSSILENESTTSVTKSTFCQTLSIERWIHDLLHVKHLPGFNSVQVKMCTGADAVFVEGEKSLVLKFCNEVCALERNICMGQIRRIEDLRLFEFLKRANVADYINESLMKNGINCQWELNSKNQTIDVNVTGQNRLHEANDTIEQSYCMEKVKVISQVSQTSLWQAKLRTLRNTFNEKIDLQVNSIEGEISLLCTQDVRNEVINELHKVEEETVLKVKSQVFSLLSQLATQLPSGIKVTTQGDQHWLVFDGDEVSVQEAKFSVYQTIRKIKQQKILIEKLIPISFIKGTAVSNFVSDNLKNKNLLAHWSINEIEHAIDVFAQDDKLQEASNTIQESYRVETFDFSNARQYFDLFWSEIEVMKEQNIEKLTTILDDLVVHVVCTTDILPEVKEIRQNVKMFLLH